MNVYILQGLRELEQTSLQWLVALGWRWWCHCETGVLSIDVFRWEYEVGVDCWVPWESDAT